MLINCPYCRLEVTPNIEGTCPSCGADIAPRNPYAQGGTPTGAQPVVIQTRQPHQEVVDFYRKLFTATPRVYMTHVLIGINVLIFAVMVFSGVNIFAPRADSVIQWGANYGPKTLGGEWWRLLSCMFLHFGIIHIAFNMWVLWDIGQLIERLVGNIGFLIIYLFCGLSGSLASVYWNPNVVSAGASGAVFGMFGVLLGYLALERHSVPMNVVKQLRSSGTTFLVYNLIFGFMVRFIDNAAHIGGLIAGFVGGILMSHSLDGDVMMRRVVRTTAVLILGVAGVSAGILAAPEPPLDLGAEESRILNVYETAYKDWERQELDDRGFASLLERDVIAPWERLSEELVSRFGSKQPNAGAALKDYMNLRSQSWQALVQFLRGGGQAKFNAYQEKWQAANRAVQKANQ